MGNGVTGLGDLVHDPVQFTADTLVLTKELSALWTSGVVAEDPVLTAFLAGPGWTVELPSWLDLGGDEQQSNGVVNLLNGVLTGTGLTGGTDATNAAIANLIVQLGGIEQIGQQKQIANRQSLNKTWGSADLLASIAGSDPLSVVQQRLATYWARVYNRRAIASITGLVSSNLGPEASAVASPGTVGALESEIGAGAGTADTAANVGNMLMTDISGLTGDANKFNFAAYVLALDDMLDSMEDVTAIALHSSVFNRMKIQNSIDYVSFQTAIVDQSTNTAVQQAVGGVIGAGGVAPFQIPFYDGKRIIIENSLKAGNIYDTWLLGAGSIRGGFGMPKVPFEPERNARAGNGGGMETITSRIETATHPVMTAYLNGNAGARAVGDNNPLENPSLNDLRGLQNDGSTPLANSTWRLAHPDRRQYPYALLRHQL